MIIGGCHITFFSWQQVSPKWHAPTLKQIDMNLRIAKLSKIKKKKIIQFEKLRWDMVVAPKLQQNRAASFDTYSQSFL